MLSIGIGGDASFDVAMVRQYPTARVFCFDPTINTSRFWEVVAMRNATDTEKSGIKFWPFGLARKDGMLPFYRTPKWQGTRTTSKLVHGIRGLGLV